MKRDTCAPAQVELPAEGSRSCVSDGGTSTAVAHCGDLVPRQEASAATLLRSVGCDVPTSELRYSVELILALTSDT